MNRQDTRAMAYRTSVTDPLRIAELPCGHAGGRLGITFCPGKQGESLEGPPWRRDLEADLDVIQSWGARAIVTLVERHELEMLGVPQLGSRVAERGMDWLHLPIVDVQPPGPAFDEAWPAALARLRAVLDGGGRVLVHCRGGKGRAGTVAACLLVDAGMAPGRAIDAVRRVRPGAIETAAQQRYVLALRPGARGAPNPERTR
jgi:ADP-ribosyl-[dinitrogen reductase] hydrolase